MNRYAKGRRLEYRAMADLRAQGYSVLRTAGSHGVFDLIAIAERGSTPDRELSASLVKAIQVKSNLTEVKACSLITDLVERFGRVLWVELWVYHDGEKEPRIYDELSF